jgi:hypothetical protein
VSLERIKNTSGYFGRISSLMLRIASEMNKRALVHEVDLGARKSTLQSTRHLMPADKIKRQ